MISQMMSLLRIKDLKQEQALRAMKAKQAQVEQAQLAVEEANGRVKAFEREMPARENAIYAEILGRIVDLDGIDGVRAKIVALEKELQELRDDRDRSLHILSRLEKELEEATAAYKLAVKNRDKYITITDTLKDEAESEAVRKEEIEIEDLFSRPMRRIA